MSEPERAPNDAPHVLIVRDGFWCVECGKRQAMEATSFDAFLAASAAFLEQHRSCKPAEVKP